VSFESTTRWMVSAAVVLVLGLFACTASGQEAPTANKEAQAPATTAPQPNSPAPGKTEPAATSAKPEQLTNAPAPATAKKTVAETAGTGKNLVEELGIQNRTDRISYAFGMDLARDLKRQKSDLNVDLLMRALKDSLDDKPLLMTDDEVTATLKQVEAEQKQDYEHAKTMIAEKNRRAGESFFSENAKKEGVVTLPSGLQYKILKKGDGKTPTLDDKVVCQYKGTLLDGTEFDSSEKRGHAVTLPVKGIMAGWTQALQMMPAGSKWQLFIPPQLAYGEKIINGIGPNAMLIFEVEVVSIEDKPQTASAAK
jgi:FKBP-type peptidyl-prolyl cis-trans isomerase